MDQQTPPASPSPEPIPAKKSASEMLLTITPVVLTVLGTVLAGLSNSEMTLAQYFRTLAAQSQSKAGDQWGLFQAKRIRGTTLEMFLDLLPLPARPGQEPASPLDAAVRLHARERTAQDRVTEFAQLVQMRKGDLPPRVLARLVEWTEFLDKTGRERDEQSGALTLQVGPHLGADQNMSRALILVSTNRWDDPGMERRAIDSAAVLGALDALQHRKTEEELMGLVVSIPPDELSRAIVIAEADLNGFLDSIGRGEKAMNQLDEMIRGHLGPTFSFHRTRLDKVDKLLDGPERKALALPEELGDGLTKLRQAETAVLSAADELKNVSKAVQHTFTARRYKIEADYNKRIAYLYELQVRQHSLTSDRHRQRSRHFFYGMLCAQAGVTISTLSLAARQRSLLWAIAGLAGLTALVFSLYVYLCV